MLGFWAKSAIIIGSTKKETKQFMLLLRTPCGYIQTNFDNQEQKQQAPKMPRQGEGHYKGSQEQKEDK